MTPETTAAERMMVPCCPQFGDDCPCDILDFHYRLVHNATVRVAGRSQVVPVEVKIHARLERCPGEMALGDLVYSTTLLPGEKVRLFTSDRRTRFTFDSASRVSYRHEQLSEERFYMASMHDFMSDVTVRDERSASSQSQGSWSFESGASGWFAGLAGGASVNARGRHSAQSTSDFLRELHSHAESSDRRAVTMTRAANSVSVGEVQSRTHTEGESEDHFESSSRTVANPNRCRAITFFFYQINKTQKVKLTIESIERRVIDAETEITNNPPRRTGGVVALPAAVLATDQQRLEAESIGRASVAAERQTALGAAVGGGAAAGVVAGMRLAAALVPALASEPLSAAVRRAALRQVEEALVAEKLLDKAGPEGKATEEVRRRFSFERCFSLPTPGLFVRGCLDECSICEPAVEKEIELELARKDLDNRLLQRRIELLEKSQEYRCCPPGAEQPA